MTKLERWGRWPLRGFEMRDMTVGKRKAYSCPNGSRELMILNERSEVANAHGFEDG